VKPWEERASKEYPTEWHEFSLLYRGNASFEKWTAFLAGWRSGVKWIFRHSEKEVTK